MNKKQKLELTWIGKENRPKLEPRILIEDLEKSYHAKHKITNKDIFDNHLIFGDNLLALKALEQKFAGKVKCVYIDPPYNSGSAFQHYEDGIEHSIWLSLMRDRLEVLRHLLTQDGSIWISIDDNEMPYLRILMDEVFGRKNFIASIIWEKVYSPKSSAKFLSENNDYVICYARDSSLWQRNLLPRTQKQDKAYKIRITTRAAHGSLETYLPGIITVWAVAQSLVIQAALYKGHHQVCTLPCICSKLENRSVQVSFSYPQPNIK